MGRSFNIEIHAWDTENDPEDVLTHVRNQVREGFTSGHDMGLYWVIGEPDEAKDRMEAAISRSISSLRTRRKLAPSSYMQGKETGKVWMSR